MKHFTKGLFLCLAVLSGGCKKEVSDQRDSLATSISSKNTVNIADYNTYSLLPIFEYQSYLSLYKINEPRWVFTYHFTNYLQPTVKPFFGVKFLAYNRQIEGTMPFYKYMRYTNSNGDVDFAYMSNRSIANTGGWNSGEVAFYAFPEETPESVPLFGMFHTGLSKHYLTIDYSLAQQLINSDSQWRLDGTLGYVLPPTPKPTTAPLPVYEYGQDNDKSHLYTLIRTYDGDGNSIYKSTQFKAYNTQVTGSVPIYIFRNNQSKDWVLQSNNSIANTGGWDNGKLAFYAFPTQVPGSIPVYAYWNTSDNKHLLTLDTGLTGTQWWRYDGIAFYAVPNQ